MGTGSRNYAYYYAFTAVVYLGISITAFVQIGENADDCKVKCPLLIEDSPERNYSKCACYPVELGDGVKREFAAYGFPSQVAFDLFLAGAPGSSTERYGAITGIIAASGPCFICDSSAPGADVVYSPCDSFGSCTQAGVLGFREGKPSGRCGLLSSNNVRLRGTYLSVLYAFAVFFLFMSLTCGLMAGGYWLFMDKWADDFSRLSKKESCMGFVCKNGPFVVRICNMLVLLFLLFSIGLTFGAGVCDTATNSFGETAFFDQVTSLVIAVSVVWSLGCIVGSAFNRVVAKDTPFYAPKMPTDNRDSRTYRCCVATTHAVIGSGP